MDSDDPQFCPVHGDPNDSLNGWPCPVAVEGDPPEKKTCPHFEAMLLRNVEDVKAGNYFEMFTGDDGKHWSQEYRLHQRVGEPTRMWSDKLEEEIADD